MFVVSKYCHMDPSIGARSQLSQVAFTCNAIFLAVPTARVARMLAPPPSPQASNLYHSSELSSCVLYNFHWCQSYCNYCFYSNLTSTAHTAGLRAKTVIETYFSHWHHTHTLLLATVCSHRTLHNFCCQHCAIPIFFSVTA